MDKALKAGVGASYSIQLANADTGAIRGLSLAGSNLFHRFSPDTRPAGLLVAAWVDVPGEGGVNAIGELGVADL